jgi:hypothetical protein
MVAHTNRGQVLIEMIWVLIFFVGFSAYVIRLYKSAEYENRRNRWEVHRSEKK